MEDCSFLPAVREDTNNRAPPVVNGHIPRKVVLGHIQRCNMFRPITLRTCRS
ncbi:hypothetical protein F444_03356 [Phytophthora nicotianae P1976]|uniref:Uncharacterized protein n=1 Tax=Phytophthora nicotianae P1976 TaxID=1317066 RepID=A0A081AUE3_PHYNI|nr:hypothetical protein F444_03356 [Phytophthora nicotianae P1976]